MYKKGTLLNRLAAFRYTELLKCNKMQNFISTSIIYTIEMES